MIVTSCRLADGHIYVTRLVVALVDRWIDVFTMNNATQDVN